MTSIAAAGRDPAAGPKYLSWPDIEKQVESIARGVATDGYPQAVVGVVRGGLVPAVMAAHRLGVRDVRALEVTHTVDDAVDAVKTAGPQIRNPASLGALPGLDVLVVEDVAGTGETLEAVADLVRQAGAARVRTAVLVVNEANWTRGRPPAETVNHIGVTVRGWVVFPWEGAAAGPATGGEAA
ncbi:phosphoribosyltransferase [Kitasatospora brasiliensis]|uniref:phosphoribosyltransferase n=1 Tax=Kitasatospora brasiliensis TaxID=3058040 RepID=UPI00292EB03C|nr:phosphoribosyltransferase family protein [Kitasatospora sp. K002]